MRLFVSDFVVCCLVVVMWCELWLRFFGRFFKGNCYLIVWLRFFWLSVLWRNKFRWECCIICVCLIICLMNLWWILRSWFVILLIVLRKWCWESGFNVCVINCCNLLKNLVWEYDVFNCWWRSLVYFYVEWIKFGSV